MIKFKKKRNNSEGRLSISSIDLEIHRLNCYKISENFKMISVISAQSVNINRGIPLEKAVVFRFLPSKKKM